MFEQFGRVRTAQVLIDRETNRSRGFGFVEMEDDAEADAAIEALDGNDHDGRRLTVNEARPREPRTGGGVATVEAAAGAAAMAAAAGGGYGGGGGYGEAAAVSSDVSHATPGRTRDVGDAHSGCEGCRHE